MESSTVIPLELITDILSRVPTKDVIRFKLVSKQWLSLIHDPVFTHLHLRQSEKQDTRKLIQICRYGEEPVDPFHTMIYSINNKGIASPIHPKAYLHRISDSASCNGVLCYITPEWNVEVSNPVTGETITLPKPSFLKNRPVSRTTDIYGTVIAIGFDRRSKVYKIVGWDKDHDTEIFTLGTNSWRKIRGSFVRTGGGDLDHQVSHVSRLLDRPVYVDGVSYWCRNILSKLNKGEIFYFDYVEENYGTIQVPNDIIDSFHHYWNCWLCESRGRLCIAENQEKKSGKEKTWVITLWLLNKYEDGRQEWSCQPPITVSSNGANKIKSNIVAIGDGEIIIDRHTYKGVLGGLFLDCYNEQGQVVNLIKLEKLDGLQYYSFNQFHIGSLVRLT